VFAVVEFIAEENGRIGLHTILLFQ